MAAPIISAPAKIARTLPIGSNMHAPAPDRKGPCIRLIQTKSITGLFHSGPRRVRWRQTIGTTRAGAAGRRTPLQKIPGSAAAPEKKILAWIAVAFSKNLAPERVRSTASAGACRPFSPRPLLARASAHA
jgi:hypothetical protein